MPTSQMRLEAGQAPAAVAAQLAANRDALQALAARLHERSPATLLTVARGSSDHAAHYFAYLVMARLGRVVASLPMSVVTLHGARLRAQGLAAFAFSQSGRSPDLVAPIEQLRGQGALTAALVNDAGSPLALAAEHVLALHAGTEASVAATKSYIAQLAGGAALVAAWQRAGGAEAGHDPGFDAALAALPAQLQRGLQQDWGAAVEALATAQRLYVVARGTALAVAMEAALKFKEVCGIQAEAFSGAELRHGPMALVEPGYPVLLFAPPGPAQAGLLALAEELRGRGARVLLAAPPGTPGAELPLACGASAELDVIALAQSFYPMVEALARARGLDPDRPRHLHKVTCTV